MAPYVYDAVTQLVLSPGLARAMPVGNSSKPACCQHVGCHAVLGNKLAAGLVPAECATAFQTDTC
jgi:hypothetical protein